MLMPKVPRVRVVGNDTGSVNEMDNFTITLMLTLVVLPCVAEQGTGDSIIEVNDGPARSHGG